MNCVIVMNMSCIIVVIMNCIIVMIMNCIITTMTTNHITTTSNIIHLRRRHIQTCSLRIRKGIEKNAPLKRHTGEQIADQVSVQTQIHRTWNPREDSLRFRNHEKGHCKRFDVLLEVSISLITDPILLLRKVDRRFFHTIHRGSEHLATPLSLILHSNHEVVAVNRLLIRALHGTGKRQFPLWTTRKTNCWKARWRSDSWTP